MLLTTGAICFVLGFAVRAVISMCYQRKFNSLVFRCPKCQGHFVGTELANQIISGEAQRLNSTQ